MLFNGGYDPLVCASAGLAACHTCRRRRVRRSQRARPARFESSVRFALLKLSIIRRKFENKVSPCTL